MRFLIPILMVAAVYAFLRYQRTKALRGQIGNIKQACAEFQENLDADEYFNHRKLDLWLKAHSGLRGVVSISVGTWFVGGNLRPWVERLRKYLDGNEAIVREHNEQFVGKELEENRQLFDTLEKHPLNERQREAIVHDEDHNLVIAGAGTGKTSSIVGKVGYLVKSRKVSPNEILLLAFARKPKEEMVDRLTDKLGEDGIGLEVRTFHSLGRSIIGAVEGVMPDLAFEEGRELLAFLDAQLKELAADPGSARELIQYLAYYPQAYREPQSFDDFADFGKCHPPGQLYTLNGETVKSMEEREIANLLFLNSVEYAYELAYKYPTADAEHAQYKPDFYLPVYDLYIEHFGIDREGRVPKWFQGKVGKSASEVYSEGIEWKRRLHRDRETVLVETFSYERKEGTLLDGLRRKLADWAYPVSVDR